MYVNCIKWIWKRSQMQRDGNTFFDLYLSKYLKFLLNYEFILKQKVASNFVQALTFIHTISRVEVLIEPVREKTNNLGSNQV